MITSSSTVPKAAPLRIWEAMSAWRCLSVDNSVHLVSLCRALDRSAEPRTPLLGPARLPLAQALSAPSRRRDRSERPIFDVTAADIAIRLGPSVVEIKLGVVTALIGVPVFLAIIFRERHLLEGAPS